MKEILDSLQRAVDSENWYGALIIALCIPDICSKLEYPTHYSRERYSNWFKKYMPEGYADHLSGNDGYALRCSYLHEGNSDIEEQSVREVINKFSFSPKGSHLISFSGMKANSADDGKNICHLSVQSFCADMVEAGEHWLHDVGSNKDVQSRMHKMLEIKEENSLFGGAVRIR